MSDAVEAFTAIKEALEALRTPKGRELLERVQRLAEELEQSLGLAPGSLRVSLGTSFGPVSLEFSGIHTKGENR